MAAVAVALSFALVAADSSLGADTVRKFGWIYAFGPDGARAIMSAIASSMITVAGLTFSITMLTLQLASSQFGPRLLRNFMRDRGTQVVLGTFVSTFIYCLLVLRTIHGTENASFVPHLAVAFGVLLAVASLAILIYFIHHIATAIRIETQLAGLAAETRAAIERLYPARLGRNPQPGRDKPVAAPPAPDFDRSARPVCARASGYIQRVNDHALMRLATEHDLLLRIEAAPGHFVTDRDAILAVYPPDRVSDAIADQLRGTLVVGPDRTPYQDVAFSIRRIVEIAQRALSPGINDPTTALYCIDRLEEALLRLAERDHPSSVRCDDAGRPRVLTQAETLDALACPAFAAIARYGLQDADVIRRLLDAIGKVTRAAQPNTREAIRRLGEAIGRDSREKAALSADRQALLAGTARRGTGT